MKLFRFHPGKARLPSPWLELASTAALFLATLFSPAGSVGSPPAIDRPTSQGFPGLVECFGAKSQCTFSANFAPMVESTLLERLPALLDAIEKGTRDQTLGERYRNTAVRLVSARWAAIDPKGFMETKGKATKDHVVLLEAMIAWYPVDPGAATEALFAITLESTPDYRVADPFLGWLARRDLPKALEIMRKFMEQPWEYPSLATGLFRVWAESDAPAAWAAIAGLPDRHGIIKLYTDVLGIVASKDETTALQLLDNLPLRTSRNEVIKAWISAEATLHPDRALSLAGKINSLAAWSAYAGSCRHGDDAATLLHLLEVIPSDMREQVLVAFFPTAPGDAARLARRRQLPATLSDQILRRFLEDWLAREEKLYHRTPWERPEAVAVTPEYAPEIQSQKKLSEEEEDQALAALPSDAEGRDKQIFKRGLHHLEMGRQDRALSMWERIREPQALCRGIYYSSQHQRWVRDWPAFARFLLARADGPFGKEMARHIGYQFVGANRTAAVSALEDQTILPVGKAMILLKLASRARTREHLEELLAAGRHWPPKENTSDFQQAIRLARVRVDALAAWRYAMRTFPLAPDDRQLALLAISRLCRDEPESLPSLIAEAPAVARDKEFQRVIIREFSSTDPAAGFRMVCQPAFADGAGSDLSFLGDLAGRWANKDFAAACSAAFGLPLPQTRDALCRELIRNHGGTEPDIVLDWIAADPARSPFLIDGIEAAASAKRPARVVALLRLQPVDFRILLCAGKLAAGSLGDTDYAAAAALLRDTALAAEATGVLAALPASDSKGLATQGQKLFADWSRAEPSAADAFLAALPAVPSVRNLFKAETEPPKPTEVTDSSSSQPAGDNFSRLALADHLIEPESASRTLLATMDEVRAKLADNNPAAALSFAAALPSPAFDGIVVRILLAIPPGQRSAAINAAPESQRQRLRAWADVL